MWHRYKKYERLRDKNSMTQPNLYLIRVPKGTRKILKEKLFNNFPKPMKDYTDSRNSKSPTRKKQTKKPACQYFFCCFSAHPSIRCCYSRVATCKRHCPDSLTNWLPVRFCQQWHQREIRWQQIGSCCPRPSDFFCMTHSYILCH